MIKKHWYLFSVTSPKGKGSCTMSLGSKKVRGEDLDDIVKHFVDNGLTDSSIVAVSYLGHMTKEEFEGEA